MYLLFFKRVIIIFAESVVSWCFCFVFIPGSQIWCFFLLVNRLAGGEIDDCCAYSVLLVNLSSVYIAM